MLITEKYLKDNIIPGQELSAKSLRLYCVRGEPLHMFTAMIFYENIKRIWLCYEEK